MIFICLCFFTLTWITVANLVDLNNLHNVNVNFNDPEIQHFTALVNKHGFKIKDSVEFIQRLGNFRNAKKELTKYERKYKNTKFGLNKFSLMSDAEFENYLGGQSVEVDASAKIVEENGVYAKAVSLVPASFDYRKYGKVSSVKDQGPCGSCYAFVANAAIESQYLIQKNLSLDLSEQTIVDCEIHSFKCKGGQIGKTFLYAKNNGIPLESCYPYLGQSDTCSHRCDSKRYKISGYRAFGTSESLYPQKLYNYGPFVMFLYVTKAFAAYKSGILDIPAADCLIHGGGHFILVVGYTPDYWIAKNSWGTDWGEDGYVRFKRGQNFCNMTARVLTPYL